MLSSQEKITLQAIEDFIQSENAPIFPVTPVYRMSVPWFSNIRIKDESHNTTWTHKDRMAWEIVSVYKEIIENRSFICDDSPLPQFSIISAWSAAFAIQTQLKLFHLPNLKVLLDKDIKQSIIQQLTAIWCEIYTTEFENVPLNSQDILEKTNNKNGFDITSNKWFDNEVRFYDRLSYEIINEKADIVFIPYGTGQLFENVIQINKKVVLQQQVDSLCTSTAKQAKQCHFLWATTNNSNSKAVKLYAPFRPFTTSSKEWVDMHILRWLCGSMSWIYEFEEKFLDEAMSILLNNKIQAEHSSAAWLALLLQKKQHIDPTKKILIVSTGKSVCS